jgi:DHA2 family methylenomycin A resistance protein-like MFS transporter
MGSVPVDKAGVGSGVLNSFRQAGGSLGIAVMGAILAQYVGHAGPASPAEFVNGLHHALRISALIALLAAVIAVVTIRKVRSPEAAVQALAEAA